MKSIRKIKVIGFPFAVSRVAQGSTQTPGWLASQRWFRKLKNVEYETVKVTRLGSKDSSSGDDYQTTIRNSMELRNHTYQAFKDGYYPIVVGGDNSQALGAVLGMKRFRPAAKALILDSKIDLNTGDERKFSALEHLTGLDRTSQFKCLDLT